MIAAGHRNANRDLPQNKGPSRDHNRPCHGVDSDSLGISIFILLLCLGLSGHGDFHVFVAIISAMLGMANATSGMVLRWKMQFASAVVWWAAAITACFTSDKLTIVAFLVAIFFCQIVFGIYCMIAESRKLQARSARQGASHA